MDVPVLKQRLIFKYRVWRVTRNRNIVIPYSNRIHKGCYIENNFGGKIDFGENNEILQGVCLMTYGGTIKVGSNCSINPYTLIYGHGRGVVIGDNVLIAGHTTIIPANHVFTRTDVPIISQGTSSEGILIDDNVWIGTGCKILDGVHIEEGAIIAAGSVVNKNVKRNEIVGGVPASLIKIRE